MRAFSFTRAGHFRSRDKDSDHTIRFAIAKKPTIHANCMALCFYVEPELLPIKFYTAGIGIFDLFCCLTLTRWPSYTNLIRIPWRYTGYASMTFLCPRFRKLCSDRQTYIQTDRQTRPKLNTTPLRGWSKIMHTGCPALKANSRMSKNNWPWRCWVAVVQGRGRRCEGTRHRATRSRNQAMKLLTTLRLRPREACPAVSSQHTQQHALTSSVRTSADQQCHTAQCNDGDSNISHSRASMRYLALHFVLRQSVAVRWPDWPSKARRLDSRPTVSISSNRWLKWSGTWFRSPQNCLRPFIMLVIFAGTLYCGLLCRGSRKTGSTCSLWYALPWLHRFVVKL